MAVKKVSAEDEATDIVLQYLKKKNRPFNSTDLFNNLHGAVGKSQLVKILTSLVQDKQINGKTYGKSLVYVASQDDLECPSHEELQTMDKDIEEKKELIAQLKDENKQLSTKLSKLLESPTSAELNEKIKSVEESNKESLQRLEKLRAGNIKIDPTVREKIEKGLESYKREWRARKKLFKDIFNTITEHYPGNTKDLMEELGVETDEAAGQQLQ